jgi:hypothetical protein
MNLARPHIPNAAVFNVEGWHEDGWCEPVVTFKIGADVDLSGCQLDLWLMGEGRPQSSFSVQIGEASPFVFAMPHDDVLTVQVACLCDAGEAVEARITCDNILIHKGSDERDLSFRLNQIRFY